MQAQRKVETDTPGPSKMEAEDEAEEPAQGAWTLEDEEEDDATNHPVGAAAGSDDEVDPLDAFMAENEAAAAVPARPAVKEEAPDPLDTFMPTAIAPEVNGRASPTRVKLGTPQACQLSPPRCSPDALLFAFCCSSVAFTHAVSGSKVCSCSCTWLQKPVVIAQHVVTGRLPQVL